MIEDTDLAWAAGFMSTMGSFIVRKYPGRDNKQPRVTAQFTFISDPKYKEELESFARITQVPCWPTMQRQGQGKPDRVCLRIQGVSLDEMMARVWRYLPERRRQEFKQLKEKVNQVRQN